jgi:hypothetical protein
MNPIVTDGEYNFYVVIFFVFHEGIDFPNHHIIDID